MSAGPELTIDERSQHMFAVTSLPVRGSVPYLYPRLVPLAPPDASGRGSAVQQEQEQEEVLRLPAAVRCSQDKLSEDGLYLLENGVHLFVWLGAQLPAAAVHQLLGEAPQHDSGGLPALRTPLSAYVRGAVALVRRQRQRHMKLTLVRQRDKLDMVFRQFLVEDKGADGSASYVDYLCHLHKEIRALLT